MSDSDEQKDERLAEWKRRAQKPGDTAGTERAVEEHERYASTVENEADGGGDEGALQPEETRHDTPPGADQTAG
jgi:hypothetical protein